MAANPPHARAGLRLGEMTLAKGEYNAALEIYQQVLDVAPDLAAAHYGWGAAASELGRADEAMGAFRGAWQADQPPVLAGLRLAKMMLAKGETSAALEIFQQVMDVAPGAAEAHYGWGVAALKLGRTDEGVAAFHRAFDIKPPDPEAGLRLAEMALAKREHVVALDFYQRVLDVAPYLAEAHYGWGVTALELGRVDEARAAFHRACEANRTHIGAGLQLAELTLANGDQVAALELYQRVLALAPNLAEVHYGWGVAALELGRADEAMVAFKRALALKPDYLSAIAAEAFLSLFPDRRPARRASGQRAFICMPILPFLRDWLGGQIYLLNFARIMSCLPKSRRPRVVIAILMTDWQEVPTLRQVVERLLDCDAVIGVFDRERRLISSKPVLDRYSRHKSRLGLASADWTRDLFAQVDSTFPILYPSWGTATVPGPLFWIPDFQHRFWPAFFSPLELASRHRDIAALSERPAPIIFSSFNAQAHFREFYPRQRNRTHVWHFCTLSGPEPTASASAGYTALKLPTRFYYIANQFWPHKDHTTLFLALRRLLDAGHDMTFACTGTDLGTDTNPYSRRLLELIEKLALGRNLRLLGVLPRPTQIEIMRRACAIIQPSLFEGWSTVVEDARAFGRPLIVSDIPVHREQAGEDCVFFTPQDPGSLAAAVIAIDSTLTPGPDLNREAAAQVNLLHRARVSADQFLDILAAEKTLQP
jgi:tetratricopeptide (TPR) repeat protein